MIPKYYEKIRAAQAAQRGASQDGGFDFSILKSGGGFGPRLAQSRLVHAFLRRFWPVGRVGGLAWAARHADVAEIRRRSETFNAPYGEEMCELTGGANFALGMQPGPQYQRQLDFMTAVMRPSDIKTLIEPNAERLAKALVVYAGGEIDAVEDLLLRVAAETCADYFGLDLDDPIAFSEWLMSISALLFADYLGDEKVRALALKGAARVRRVLDASIARAHEAARLKRAPPPAGSAEHAAAAATVQWYANTLVGRLVELQLTQANGPTNDEIRAILVGASVGYVPTGAGAGGNILNVLLKRPDWFTKAQEAARAGRDKELLGILREAMRFSPPINPGVPRYVTQETKLGRAILPQGTMIIAASMSAMFDPRVVKHAGRFDPTRSLQNDLQFGGPFPHYCIGESITDALLLQSFKPLLAQRGLWRAEGARGRLEKTGPFPRHLHLSYKPARGQRTQSMVTICLPLARDVPVAVVNKALDKLGNPARRSPLPQAGLADALDRTGIVHFAHMTAVEGKTGARGSDFLIVELSADGPAEDAVVAFFEAGKSWLMPVLTLATNVSSEPEIRHLLVKNIRRLVAGRILPRRTTASGLNFVGTPELSVERIEREAGLATEVRARLEDCMTLPGAATAPAMTILRHVRESVRRGPLREGLARPRSQKLGLSHRANRTFQEAFGALLADWRFSGKFVIGTLVLLAVFHAATHGVRSWGDAGQAVTLLARIAASLAIGGGATIAAAAVLHRATPGEAGKPAAPLQSWLASHIAGVAILTILFAFLHFVLFQTTVHEAAWDGEPIDVRAALAVTTLVDILVTAAVGLLLLGLLVGVAIAIVLFFLRRSETTSPVEDFDPPFDRVKELLHRENPPGHVQNHIIAVTPLKTDPRWLRRMTLGLAFWGIEKMVQHQFRPGFVLDLGTIHFARWFRLPGTDKLAFLSNYSGSWESYLEDFITKAHGGQTAVWSNGVGFPETRFLLQGGAEHGAKFKRWVRRQQVETRFWYSRFPALTTSQMRANALICEGLAKACTVNDAQAWLDLFGSRPRPSGLLDFEEIQALVFNGMGRQRSAELLPVRIPEGSEGWREWLRALAGETGSVSTLFQAAAASPDAVAFGEAPPKERAACVAFSAEGLRRMGLDRISYHQAGAPASTSLGSFPQAFVDGMASEERARILGDAGEGHPSKWRWYAEATPHAVLLLYASDRTSLDAYAADVRKRLTGTYGLNVLAPIRMQDLPENLDELREPFGFHDGVSQPIMRGTRRFHDSVNAMHAVEPGEFILGYPDNRGDIPPSPVVDDTYDDDILPDLVANLPSRFPDFRGERAAAPRDLGRNGSFLVIRQLEQNVAGFNAHADRLAAQLQPAFPNENITRDWVTARMVGRWQDGSSLARHPSAPGGAPDNDFLFGADDPQGNRCPYGAHIRRAFPRDSLNPEHKQQLEISNRHRILRRGRAYEAWEGEDRSEGLVFMALNADIERQFEFVQQTWISSPTFHDVSEEIDPIATGRTQTEASSGGGAFTIQSSAGPVTLRNIQSFVTVKNGGYFFLPSRSALRFLATLPK